jgi:hypothetical protein
MPTFGAVVLGLRDMKHLAECLKSVAWADEILLLYAGGAPEIGADEIPALKVRAIRSLAEAKNYIGEMTTDWVLRLWAEERLDAELAREIRALCRDESRNKQESYRLAIRSHILGEWAEGGVSGSSPVVRLSRKTKDMPLGWWSEETAATTLASGWIEDRAGSELRCAVERVQDLSDFWANYLHAMDSPPGPMTAVFCSLKIFVKTLARNRIFSCGLAAVALAALASYAVLLSGAKLWEARHGVKQGA